MIGGTVGFAMMLVAVQALTVSGTAAIVAGWTLMFWGIGAVPWSARELWATRARPG
jgi:hypothetical protein